MEYTEEQHKKALKLFIPAKGYELNQYYGVSLIKLKKNNKFSIKLMHGWSESGKNSMMSEAVTVANIEDAIQLYTLLEQFSQDGETKSANLDFLNESEPSIVENAYDGSEKVTSDIIAKDDVRVKSSEEQPVITPSNIFDE